LSSEQLDMKKLRDEKGLNYRKIGYAIYHYFII